MKKKIAAIVIFIFVLVFPMVSWPVLFPFDKTELNENRKLAEFPEFNNEFFINFDKFFTDHLPFRNDYIKFYSKFENSIENVYIKILGSLGVPYYVIRNNVILGKNGWLYYNGWVGENLKYYLGTNLPTEEELSKMVENAEKVSNYFESQGKQFVFYIAPNKEQIYYENMPNGIRVVSEIKRMDMIVDYFQKHSNVKILYPKDELLEAKSEKQIYYKYDTHWNEAGGYYGVLPLLKTLGISVGDVSFTEKERIGGDLSAMLANTNTKDVGYNMIYRPEIEVTGPKVELNQEFVNAKICCTSTNTNGKKLFVMGDSFRLAMVDVLSKEFSSSKFYNGSSLWFEGNQSSLDEEFAEADTIIFETLERGEEGYFDFFEKFVEAYGL